MNRETALSVFMGIYSFLRGELKSSYFNPFIPKGGFAKILSNFLVIGSRMLSPLSKF